MNISWTPEEKNTELQRYRLLLLATIDYIMSREVGRMVLDDHDQMKEIWEMQKADTENYFKAGSLNKLQGELEKMTSGIMFNADLQFANYIKEKTGEDFDLFSGLDEQIAGILERGKIQNEKEDEAVMVQLNIYQQTGSDPVKQNELLRLMSNYCEQLQPTEDPFKYQRTRRFENGEKQFINISSDRPPPAFEDEYIAISPDRKRKLQIYQSSREGSNAQTSVNIFFSEGNLGPVLAARGLHPDLKAYWKDNHTIVIETPKGFETFAQHYKLQSVDDVVMVEYIEI